MGIEVFKIHLGLRGWNRRALALILPKRELTGDSDVTKEFLYNCQAWKPQWL